MDKEEINKRIQDENARHQRELLNLSKKKYKEDERHQREINYLASEKQRLKSQQMQSNEELKTKSKAKVILEYFAKFC